MTLETKFGEKINLYFIKENDQFLPLYIIYLTFQSFINK